METKTSTASAIDITQANAEYDASCKRLLSEKSILAWILKSCVAEFRDLDIKTIAEQCIEGTPRISEIPVAPDETGPAIQGRNTEQSSPTEGTVYFDIYFDAVVPGTGEVVQLIINVEAQGDFYPGYPIPKRAIFYCSRLISAQSGTVFVNSEYQKLRKVYSIWICMDPPASRRNSITRYCMTEQNLVGEDHEPVENYDLISMVMIHLGGEKDQHGEQDRNYSGVLKLLGTLLTSEASAAEKKRLLQEEYRIPMTKTIEEEVSKMYPFSQYIEARGYQKGESAGYQRGESVGYQKGESAGYQKGHEKTMASNLKLLMKNSGFPFEQAASVLELPREEWSSYARLIEQTSGASAP